MMYLLLNVYFVVVKLFDVWYVMVECKDFGVLELIVYLDVVFCLLMVFKLYGLVFVLLMVLCMVIMIFDNFMYYCQFVIDDGKSVVLEFGVIVGDKVLKGIDMICFDDDGWIVEFEVMVWLFNVLQVFGVEMGVWFGQQLLVFKIGG